MYVIDYFEGDMAVIKNGDESVFLDRHLLPKGAREGDVLAKHSNIEKFADAKSVAILVCSEKTA